MCSSRLMTAIALLHETTVAFTFLKNAGPCQQQEKQRTKHDSVCGSIPRQMIHVQRNKTAGSAVQGKGLEAPTQRLPSRLSVEGVRHVSQNTGA